MDESTEIDNDNVIRVMVATDSHLGYAENDPIRGEDSFTAFEEMLEMAVTEDVDFILLGGDLFHDAVPSQSTLYKCMNLLRRYTFGDKMVPIEILSDEAHSFQSSINDSVNYNDPDLNISIPVFSIHGNHDDPSSFGRLSSLDLLSTTGLINYFGRWTDLTKVVINPILLRKGETKMALYGLSHIHDARLARLFEAGKVTMEHPSGIDEWFQLLVLHQNRADRGPKNYLPEEMLPSFLNLVIWGHEHDCRIEPEYNHKQNFYVSQPGSSVATSLADGESLPKHVGLLEIHKTKFQMKPLRLKTVRPFVFESVNLRDLAEELHLDAGDVSNKVKTMAEKRVKVMIDKAKDLLTGHPKQPTLPLIRLRILFDQEEQMFNPIRFGQIFQTQVANSSDVVHLKKVVKRIFKPKTDFDRETMSNVFKKMEIEASTRVEDLVDLYFVEKDNLKILPSHAFAEMCYRMVDRADHTAAANIVKCYKEAALNHLMEKLPSCEGIDDELNVLKNTMTRDKINSIIDNVASTNNNRKTAASGSNDNNAFLFNDQPTTALGRKVNVKDEANTTSMSTRGRGARGGARGRGSRGARGGASSSNAARNANPMPQLNVSVNERSNRQPTLLDAFNGAGDGDNSSTSNDKPRILRRKPTTYVISDSE